MESDTTLQWLLQVAEPPHKRQRLSVSPQSFETESACSGVLQPFASPLCYSDGQVQQQQQQGAKDCNPLNLANLCQLWMSCTAASAAAGPGSNEDCTMQLEHQLLMVAADMDVCNNQKTLAQRPAAVSLPNSEDAKPSTSTRDSFECEYLQHAAARTTSDVALQVLCGPSTDLAGCASGTMQDQQGSTQDIGWFHRCRGCGQMTSSESDIGNGAVMPLCRCCCCILRKKPESCRQDLMVRLVKVDETWKSSNM